MSIALGNVTTTTGNVYVSSGSTAVTWLSITNYSAANVTANVFVVPNNDIAGNLNVILANIEIAVNDTYQIYNAGEKLLLDSGDSIQANASADNSINTVTSFTAI